MYVIVYKYKEQKARKTPWKRPKNLETGQSLTGVSVDTAVIAEKSKKPPL